MSVLRIGGRGSMADTAHAAGAPRRRGQGSVGTTAVTRLEPVDDPRPSRVLDLPEAPAIRGTGEHSYGCGSCGAVLFEDLAEPYTVRCMAVRCPGCGKYNRAPAS
jgi:hypothetical protein